MSTARGGARRCLQEEQWGSGGRWGSCSTKGRHPLSYRLSLLVCNIGLRSWRQPAQHSPCCQGRALLLGLVAGKVKCKLWGCCKGLFYRQTSCQTLRGAGKWKSRGTQQRVSSTELNTLPWVLPPTPPQGTAQSRGCFCPKHVCSKLEQEL